MCSIKLLASKKVNIALRRLEVNTFSGTDWRVIGRKFSGKFVSLFLWISIVQAFFYLLRIDPESHTALIIERYNKIVNMDNV